MLQVDMFLGGGMGGQIGQGFEVVGGGGGGAVGHIGQVVSLTGGQVGTGGQEICGGQVVVGGRYSLFKFELEVINEIFIKKNHSFSI
jgi:hypothetical protein